MESAKRRSHGMKGRRNQKSSQGSDSVIPAKKIVLLHGNRQTSEILLGRLDRFQKKLKKELNVDLVAPDAPLPVEEDSLLLTWWHRVDNDYQGLDTTLHLLQSPPWNDDNVVGVMGFSQGARLVHLLARLHQDQPSTWFPNLKFVMLVAGYDAPFPDDHFHLSNSNPDPIKIASLHVWGLEDPLISPEQSESLSMEYVKPEKYIHPGKHFVPAKGADIQFYLDFLQKALSLETVDHRSPSSPAQFDSIAAKSANPETKVSSPSTMAAETLPDEETATMQQDEVEALQAIYPEEVMLRSSAREVDGETNFDFPIVYHIKLLPTNEDDNDTRWPAHPLTLEIRYPHNYPLQAIPLFRLLHQNNNFEFPSTRVDQIMSIVKETSEMELGMPSVLSSVYGVKEYLDASPSGEDQTTNNLPMANSAKTTEEQVPYIAQTNTTDDTNSLIGLSSMEKIQKCNLEGLEIAELILKRTASIPESSKVQASSASKKSGGGFWDYIIGLVGKPSAGKSTFFNAATAFSRQRGGGAEEASTAAFGDSEWGGASMAAHPFTTIDPNIGYCLVPAPFGLCPEDSTQDASGFASTHGRSSDGRRLLPVLLKDVAGLVPGAYQGRGRGNQFLNDLTDANVLIHVVDASGTADAQGNTTVTDNDTSGLTNPLDDLAWIRNELVEWVYSNVTAKWDVICRKGRVKLLGMFTGYGQREAEIRTILSMLEQFLDNEYSREHAMDHLEEWNQADIHRLVSCFLGVRFPMALALNKCDLPSGLTFADEIRRALPIHGAHAGTPMEAQKEMLFVRKSLKGIGGSKLNESPPKNVWNCLTSAMTLREPILVFPVNDLTTYAPLPGLNRGAAESPSLPSSGMIRCIDAAGGSIPACWDDLRNSYTVPSKDEASRQKLRDVLIMKPFSTVEDVFLVLKKLGGLSGEFIRAEAVGDIGDKPKPIPKLDLMGKRNRIIRIMSNKRAAWQT